MSSKKRVDFTHAAGRAGVWLVTSSAISGIISIVEHLRGSSLGGWIGFTMAVLLFICAFVVAWSREYDRAEELNNNLEYLKNPKFVVEVHAALSHLQGDCTLVVLNLKITNEGADSAISDYFLHYKSDTLNEKAKLVVINKDLDIPMGPARYVFRRVDALNFQTGLIKRGDFRAGRIPFIISGDRTKEIPEGKALLTVIVTDYLKKSHSCEWRGAGQSKVPTYMTGDPIIPMGTDAVRADEKANKKRIRKR